LAPTPQGAARAIEAICRSAKTLAEKTLSAGLTTAAT
jgi:hypothetical protein